MSRMRMIALGVVLAVGMWASSGFNAAAQVRSNDNRIQVMDNCLPGDPGWDPTGGCTLRPQDGDVPLAEFLALLTSPLSGGLVGHPSWRNEPSHLSTNVGGSVRVSNGGGRGHTFTEVADFGGGFVSQLNVALTPAPECLSASVVPLPPGASQEVSNLDPGLHKFQCCIHPWMRATIRVE